MRLLAVRVVIPAIILQFAFGMVYVWGAVAPYVRLQDHWSPLLISAVFSAGPFGYGTGILIGGRLADHYPPRRLCWAGVALMVIGFTIAFLIPNGITLVIFYSAIALGLGGSLTLAGALAAGTYTLPTRVGFIGGALTGSYGLAAIIQVPIVSYLASTIGWLNALRIVGASMAALAVCMVVLMPPIPRPQRTQGGTGSIPLLKLVARELIWTGFLLEAVASPLGSYAFVAIASYVRDLPLALWIATIAVIAVATGNAIGRIVSGTASDRFGITPVFLVILTTNMLAAILLQFPVNAATVLFAALAAGISFGGPAGLLSRLASVSAPDAPNSTFGLLFVGYACGVFYGPFLGVAVGGNARSWLVLGSLAVIGLLLLGFRTVVANGFCSKGKLVPEVKHDVDNHNRDTH
jgi:MFS transporter, OFA family, oxalate/formate antiporter